MNFFVNGQGRADLSDVGQLLGIELVFVGQLELHGRVKAQHGFAVDADTVRAPARALQRLQRFSSAVQMVPASWACVLAYKVRVLFHEVWVFRDRCPVYEPPTGRARGKYRPAQPWSARPLAWAAG